MYSFTARILLDVHDPLMRNISMGQFGFRRARKELEVTYRGKRVQDRFLMLTKICS